MQYTIVEKEMRNISEIEHKLSTDMQINKLENTRFDLY